MTEKRKILVDPDGQPLAEHQLHDITELLNRGQRRIEMDLWTAVDAGRLAEAADWVRESVGASDEDLVFVVSAEVLSRVEAWTRFEARHKTADEKRRRGYRGLAA